MSDNKIQLYLPQLLQKWYNNNTKTHKFTDHQGILLFADTSGFTELTRKLSKRGVVGFEILTNLLNTIFQSMESVITNYHGDILKFSGDAIWCYFPQKTPIFQCYTEMLAEIGRINKCEEICQEHPLTMHAGAASGKFQMISVGLLDKRLEFEIYGNLVTTVYKACDEAGASELVIDKTLFDRSNISISDVKKSDEFFLIASTPHKQQKKQTIITSKNYEIPRRELDVIRYYLPDGLRQRLREIEGKDALASEHRKVAVLFTEVKPKCALSEKETNSSLEEFHRITKEIFSIIKKHNGCIARLDPFGSGHKLLTLFGAISKSQDDNINALQTAREITELKSKNFEIKSGLTYGELLCGEVGSLQRREYTVMGEAVNAAARLMSKATTHTILMDNLFYQCVNDICNCELIELSLKGIGNNVTIHKFVSLKEEGTLIPTTKDFIGRHEYLDKLNSIWQKRESGRIKTICITGNPGVGKTSLCAEFIKQSNQQVFYISATSAKLHPPAYLIRQWLKRLYGVETNDNQQLFEEIVSTAKLDRKWLPLLDNIFALKIDDTEWTKGLAPELRIERTTELLIAIINSAPFASTTLIFDDMESSDSYSLYLLEMLNQQAIKADLTLILMGNNEILIEYNHEAESLKLYGLSKQEVDKYLLKKLTNGKREQELIGLINEKSEGNPLFIKETLSDLQKKGVLDNLSDVQLWDVVKPISDIKIAEKIEDLELSYFDSLPEDERNLLKTASILGDSFFTSEISKLHNDEKNIVKKLKLLVSKEFLRSDRDKQYHFCRSQTRNTIYNCIPLLTRKKLHKQIGDYLVLETGDRELHQLAYHFSRSDDIKSGFSYSLQAALSALQKQMLIEVAEHFEKCRTLLNNDSTDIIDNQEKLSYYRNASDFAVLEGRYNQAFRLLHKRRKSINQFQQKSEYFEVVNDFARLLWKQSKFERLTKVLSYSLNNNNNVAENIIADTYAILAELNRRTGKFQEAQTASREAIKFSERSHDVKKQAEAHNNLGLAYWGIGDIQSAQDAFETSLKLGQGILGKAAEAKSFNNLAILSEELGDYLTAEKLLRKAKEIFCDLGDRRNSSYATGNLANILTYFGKYQEALNLFQTADRIFVKLEETHPHYYTVGNIADIELLLGDNDTALDKYQQVMEFAKESSDKELEAETYVRFADLEFFTGDKKKATELYSKGISLAEEIESLEFQIKGRIGLCRLYIGQQESINAQEEIGKLMSFAKESNSDRTLFEAVFLQGEKERITGNCDQSISCYNKCIEYAIKQYQFELNLKCNVRIAETSETLRAEAVSNIKKLLIEFEKTNGEEFLNMLIKSDYFKFFANTIREVKSENNIVTTPLHIG